MTAAHFVFTKFKNSFSVHVTNLEDLSIEQIQSIEKFVKLRKGIFDFSIYTFIIQKRLNFNEFVLLIENIFPDAICQERSAPIEQSNKEAKLEFGKYKGIRYCELPDSYLLWLKGNYKGKDRHFIDSELSSRNL